MLRPMKTIAIIGYGTVGRAFGEMAGNHYRIVACDPQINDSYPEAEINRCELAVICVPTNGSEDGSCDVTTVEKTVKKIDTPLILIKSTVIPGTTDRLREETNKRICFSPEYIGESTYYNPFWEKMIDIPFMIFGGDEDDCSRIVALLEPIGGPLKNYYLCSALEAEIIKYMENCFFACKVTFVNEFYNLCRQFGANWHKVREGWLLDTRINRMHTSVFEESRGFNGKCLPKDLKAIIKCCENAGYSADFLKAIEESNIRFRKRIDK